MDDVASVKNENANLRKIQQKLLQWEITDKPLAPLTSFQQDTIEALTQLCADNIDAPTIEIETVNNKEIIEQLNTKSKSELFNDLSNQSKPIDSIQSFLTFYEMINLEAYNHTNTIYKEYYEQLLNRSEECDKILIQIDSALISLTSLQQEYNFVSNKTSSLNTASEKLILEQKQLSEISYEIKRRLHYFTQAEQIAQRLQSPTLSVSSEIFVQTLNKIDECLDYLKSNIKFKDASTYIIKYKHSLAKGITMMKNYLNQIFINATEQVFTSRQTAKIGDKSSDAAFAIFYGKFQASAPKAKRIINVIEERLNRSLEYEQVLSELHQIYLSQRAQIMSPGVDSAIKDLANANKGDNCALVRSSCAFIVHVCQDEHRLFYQFFTIASIQLITYLEGLCTILYDTLRPHIIHINHLETLADICSILRVEMIDENVQHNPDSLEAFGKIANQLLQDVQERLVFRAHLYLQSDILYYKPSPGDLAYPEKLEMMESIALSLQETIPLKRVDSRASMISMGSITSQEVDSITSAAAEQQLRARTGNSPADLHGMWYPTVRRTLVCLSRLYRCVDRPIFQGLSQEALTHCVQSVSSAAQQISVKKTAIDGELFEIKHLLILREQIAPFRVDFTMKETSLDFSKVKTAAYGLLQKRKQLFALGTNNALLEFLLDGTPQVKEHLHDSRKDVDRQLKTVCELFIRDGTKLLIEPILKFNEKAQVLLKQSSIGHQLQQPSQQQQQQQQENINSTQNNNNNNTIKINYILRQTQWASPQQISGIIQESQRLIKNKLTSLQRSMQLYLSNKDTEFILFRPIRNNLISAFVKLEQILTTNGYSRDDLIIASCPTADQISVLLSSASILADNSNIAMQQQQQQQQNRKISTSSISAGVSDNDKINNRKISLEKKVSFDDNNAAKVVIIPTSQPSVEEEIVEDKNVND